MKFFIVLIYLILSLLTGLSLIGLSLDMIDGALFFNYLQKEMLTDNSLRLILILTGLLLILLALRYIQISLNFSRKNKTINFKTEQGKVSITVFAIEDMLKRVLEKKAEVSHLKVKVSLHKNMIEVVTRGVLTAEANLVELTKEIQEIIKTKMYVILGEEKQVKIDLEIHKVSFGGKKNLVEEKDPEIPFRNY